MKYLTKTEKISDPQRVAYYKSMSEVEKELGKLIDTTSRSTVMGIDDLVKDVDPSELSDEEMEEWQNELLNAAGNHGG